MNNNTSELLNELVPKECQNIYGLIITSLLFLISEILALSKCPANGVIHSIILLLYKKGINSPSTPERK